MLISENLFSRSYTNLGLTDVDIVVLVLQVHVVVVPHMSHRNHQITFQLFFQFLGHTPTDFDILFELEL